jgi:hypothetical protein
MSDLTVYDLENPKEPKVVCSLHHDGTSIRVSHWLYGSKTDGYTMRGCGELSMGHKYSVIAQGGGLPDGAIFLFNEKKEFVPIDQGC